MDFIAVSASLAALASLEDGEERTEGEAGGGRDEDVCSGCDD